MRARSYGAIVTLVVCALAGGATVAGQTRIVPGPQVAPRPQPPLFPVPLIVPPTQRPRQQVQPPYGFQPDDLRPTIVCGMTVIPALPDVDPKFVKKAPDDKTYTMRFVPPPACGTTTFSFPTPNPQAGR